MTKCIPSTLYNIPIRYIIPYFFVKIPKVGQVSCLAVFTARAEKANSNKLYFGKRVILIFLQI